MFGSKKSEVEPDQEFFTIFDTKVGNYRDPVLSKNQFEMTRHLEIFMKNPANVHDPLFANAEDFQLFKVGQYYRRNGTIEACQPQHVANCHDIKAHVMRSMAATPSAQAPGLGIVPT